MPAGDRMPDVGPRLLLLFRQRRQMRVVDLVEARAAEARPAAHDLASHIVGQRGERGIGVGVQRVAVRGRKLERVDERARVRQHLVFAVGMPSPSRALHADRLVVLLDVRDDQHLGDIREG